MFKICGLQKIKTLSKMVVKIETGEDRIKKHAELVVGVNLIELIPSLLLQVQVLLTQ